MSESPIRVLLVDDSALSLALLRRLLEPVSGIEIIATASNGAEALDRIEEFLPDVVCTDYVMPVMNGLTLVKRIMDEHPLPILVVSSVIDRPETAFPLLAAGALDFFPKPAQLGENEEECRRELVQKIRVLSRVYVFRRASRIAQVPPKVSLKTKTNPRRSILAIGASTGGPQVVHRLLAALHSPFPAPILYVQHISRGFLSPFATWLEGASGRCVRIVTATTEPEPNVVYVPAEDTHLEMNERGELAPTSSEPSDGHRPSVTVTFRSVARHARDRSVGVLLTGMGRDGADGLKSLADVGALTIAQSAESCVVYGMPKEAVELDAAQYTLAPDAIAEVVNDVFRR
jgi:two-component system chemotaxis response regulator CheB